MQGPWSAFSKTPLPKPPPTAIKAIRECDSYHHEMDGERVIKMPGEKLPKGTQTIYERRSLMGKSKVFAYTDSGVLNGWQLN